MQGGRKTFGFGTLVTPLPPSLVYTGVARRVKVRWEPLSPGNTRSTTTPTQPVSFRNPRRRFVFYSLLSTVTVRFFFLFPPPMTAGIIVINCGCFAATAFICANRKQNGKIIIVVYYRTPSCNDYYLSR